MKVYDVLLTLMAFNVGRSRLLAVNSSTWWNSMIPFGVLGVFHSRINAMVVISVTRNSNGAEGTEDREWDNKERMQCTSTHTHVCMTSYTHSYNTLCKCTCPPA